MTIDLVKELLAVPFCLGVGEIATGFLAVLIGPAQLLIASEDVLNIGRELLLLLMLVVTNGVLEPNRIAIVARLDAIRLCTLKTFPRVHRCQLTFLVLALICELSHNRLVTLLVFQRLPISC